MKLLNAAALGAIAAIGIPFIMRGQSGQVAEWARYWTVEPAPGSFGIHLSVPIFLFVTLFAWVLMGWSDR